MSKLSRSVLFAVSILTFLISVKLFWNMGVYVDEAGTSPDKVCGGDFWLYMDWLRLLLLLTVCRKIAPPQQGSLNPSDRPASGCFPGR